MRKGRRRCWEDRKGEAREDEDEWGRREGREEEYSLFSWKYCSSNVFLVRNCHTFKRCVTS